MNQSLADLFPDGDYRFHLTLRRAPPEKFFAPQDQMGRVLAERARWLAAEPARYAALRPEGEAVVREFAAMVTGWSGAGSASETGRRGRGGSGFAPARELLSQLGGTLEPDILFLAADTEGRFRLQGGALCFPTGWALEEKIGHPLDIIHGVVPGLNPALASPIQQFLTKLKPGTAFLRDNWGIAATDELNLHPARRMRSPAPPVDLAQLWLRVEHQALLALPESRGIVFGIRIALHRLDTLAGTPAASGLRRALATMSRELIGYKRLDTVRDALLEAL